MASGARGRLHLNRVVLRRVHGAKIPPRDPPTSRALLLIGSGFNEQWLDGART
jgi:hypothetical protein